MGAAANRHELRHAHILSEVNQNVWFFDPKIVPLSRTRFHCSVRKSVAIDLDC
jgi:hypothetical protein